MQIVIKPSKVSGTITAPASKSAMQRACAAALIKKGKTILHNPGISADDKAALTIIQQLGATVEMVGNTIEINSNGIDPVASEINCGESGLSVRMFTSIAALGKQEITITGTGSLLKRPVSFFNEVLPQLNVACHSNNGLLPLKIKGPMHPKNIEVDGSLSSQFLTGLLFAYSASISKTSFQVPPKEGEPVTIKVKNLNSRPYIDLTLQIIKDFGLKVPVNKNYKEFYFDDKPLNHPTTQLNPSTPQPLNYFIEGDWSGAAFLLVAGAIAGSITVKGLDIFSTQADKAILQVLMQTGANINSTEEQIEIKNFSSGDGGKPFRFNATDCPDLFPPLAALAAYCNGTSVIEGVHRLTHKESNRALTLQEEFGKMGVEIILQDDLMLVKGGTGVKSARVSSRHDHRIAMACAVAALKADGETVIGNAEAVNKSYPQFWEHLQKLRVILSFENSVNLKS